MPLFMDIHKVDSDHFTVEDIVKAHMEDVAVQHKYGVRHKKYWVNVKSKTVFCLMEGPSAEACNEVHLEAHGATACNMIEVFDDEYNMFLGAGNQDEHELAQTASGEVDTGYRTILLVHSTDFSGQHGDIQSRINNLVSRHEGTLIRLPANDVMASFVDAAGAIRCAIEADQLLGSFQNTVEYRIAIVTGKPVDEFGTNLFEEAKRSLYQLCLIGQNRAMYIDEDSTLLARKELDFDPEILSHFHIRKQAHLDLAGQLISLLNEELDNSTFTVESIGAALGLSKSQAYRKIHALTGMSPNELIQEVRLRHSLDVLKTGHRSVSEVAYDSGFSSPTYFTRVFRKRFQVLPKEYAKLHIQ